MAIDKYPLFNLYFVSWINMSKNFYFVKDLVLHTLKFGSIGLILQFRRINKRGMELCTDPKLWEYLIKRDYESKYIKYLDEVKNYLLLKSRLNCLSCNVDDISRIRRKILKSATRSGENPAAEDFATYLEDTCNKTNLEINKYRQQNNYSMVTLKEINDDDINNIHGMELYKKLYSPQVLNYRTTSDGERSYDVVSRGDNTYLIPTNNFVVMRNLIGQLVVLGILEDNKIVPLNYIDTQYVERNGFRYI